MLKGWDNEVMFNLNLQRQVAFVIAETMNRTMGGRGVIDFVRAAFPTGEKKEDGVQWNKDRIDAILAASNKRMLEKGFKIRNN